MHELAAMSLWRRSSVVHEFRRDRAAQQLSRAACERAARRQREHIEQHRRLRERDAAQTARLRKGDDARASHEQAWARHEAELQERQRRTAAAREQRFRQRHQATQRWHSEHGARTRQLVARPKPRGEGGAAPPPPQLRPPATPGDNRREALLREQIDGAQAALAKERFSRSQLPHEQALAAQRSRYARVRAIKGTVAAKELCDRHQIDEQREHVFSEGRQSLQLTMRTTLGLELQRSTAAAAAAH